MLAIKLRLAGRKKQRSFRVIVQEARSKLNGKFVEDIGWYNPHTNQFKLNKERVNYWIEKGAQPTESAARVIAKSSSSETETYEVRAGRKRKKKEKTAGSAEQAAPAGGEEDTAETAPAESADAKKEEDTEEESKDTPEAAVEEPGEEVEEKETGK